MSGIIVGGDCRVEGLLSAYDNLLITNDDANGTILNFLNTSVSSHTANIKLNTSYFQINDESDTNVLYFDTSNSLSQIYINRSLGVLGGSSLISKDVINSNLLSATDVNTSNCTVSSLTASKIVVSDTNKKLVSSSIDASELSKLTNVVVKNPTAPQIISGNYLQMILTNSTDAALVVRDSTATVASQLVIYAGGKVEWGSGTESRDTNLYRLGANYLRTDDKFESSQGIRTIGYSSSGLTGPGLEMHYDGGSNFGRILCIDRPTSTRKSIWIDGLDITFYTNAGNIRAGITSGGDFRLDGFSTTPYVLVSDANKYIKQSTITTTELGYLSGVTSSIQTQLNGLLTDSHTHSNKAYLDFINQNLSTTANVTHNKVTSFGVVTGDPTLASYDSLSLSGNGLIWFSGSTDSASRVAKMITGSGYTPTMSTFVSGAAYTMVIWGESIGTTTNNLTVPTGYTLKVKDSGSYTSYSAGNSFDMYGKAGILVCNYASGQMLLIT